MWGVRCALFNPRPARYLNFVGYMPGSENCGDIWSIFGHFSGIYPLIFLTSTVYTPALLGFRQPIRVNRSRRGWVSRHHYRYCRINSAVLTASHRYCGADLGYRGYRRHPGQGLAPKSRSDFSVSRAGRYIQAKSTGGTLCRRNVDVVHGEG